MRRSEPADRVAISGLWRGGEVVASRIDRLREEGPTSLQGLLLRNGDDAVVGGTQLDADCCVELATPAYVSLVGNYGEERLNVGRIDAGSELLFSERVDRLIVEAFLARDPVGDGFHLSGFGIPADQSAAIDTPPGVRSLFVGAYDDAFLIRRSIPLPDGRSGRADALRALGGLVPSD